MIEKLTNKSIEYFITLYQNDPFITIAVLLTAFVFIGCAVYLFKYLIVIFFALITTAILAFCLNSYMETRTLEYQLAQQMIAENCTDTIELEFYLTYENITFVDGKQYRYGQAPIDSIVRNYVCHSSKRTYSVDFLLDVYKNRPTFNEQIDEFKNDLDLVREALNKKTAK